MREYAKECLRELEDKATSKKFVATLRTMPVTDTINGEQFLEFVRDGLRRRANIADTPQPTESIFKQVDLSYIKRTLEMPCGPLDAAGQVAMFRIDWRADDAALQQAFSEWLKAQRTSLGRSRLWFSRIRALMVHSITGYEDLPLVDYNDAADGIRNFDTSTSAALAGYREGSSTSSIDLIAPLRTLAGKKVGRGDSKLSLLTDLGIYRLHRAGVDAREMESLLGKKQLKFYDTALIKRAIQKARAHTQRTLKAAIFCEGYVLAMRNDVGLHTPPRRASRGKL